MRISNNKIQIEMLVQDHIIVKHLQKSNIKLLFQVVKNQYRNQLYRLEKHYYVVHAITKDY